MKRLAALAVVAGVLVAPAAADAKLPSHRCSTSGRLEGVTVKVNHWTTCKVGRRVANRLLDGPVYKTTASGDGLIWIWGTPLTVSRPNAGRIRFTDYRARAGEPYRQDVYVDLHFQGG